MRVGGVALADRVIVAGGGFTSTTKVDLLVGGTRTYLPLILQNYSPLNSIIR